MATNELFPVVAGIVIGKATRGECHSGSMILHPVVHLHIFSLDHGSLYLQKRSPLKDIQPNKWDTAVGGHVDFGETILDALCRESREELSLQGFTPIHLRTYIFQSSIEREMVHSYATFVDPATVSITPDHDEVTEGKFWNVDEINENLGKGIFTPNFEQEFVVIKEEIETK